MLYEGYDVKKHLINHLYFATIDMLNDGGLGEVLEKDIDLIVQGESNDWVADWGKLTACKHANGRDWWIVVPHSLRNKIYIYLLSPNGINLIREKEFGKNKVSKKSFGQASFSPDGTHYAIWGGDKVLGTGYIRIYDFDRCTGELINEKSDTMLTIYGSGLCFSPNSEYLYISNDRSIVQFDFKSVDFFSSKKLVAIWDKWKGEFNTRFTLSFMALGQDKKIYIIPNGASSGYINMIKYPDKQGKECEVKQHTIKLPTVFGISATIPNYPNFRLGPIDGSDCDTLGIDNIPVSKFSYEQDSFDFLKVQFTDLSYFDPRDYLWDFGDGGTSKDVNPDYIFSHKGIYKVCLTVANSNATDKYCQTMNIGITDNLDVIEDEIKVGIFPNPVDDILLVTIRDYLPQDATLEFITIEGKKILASKVKYGWNSIDVSNLKAGVYIYRVVDGIEVLKRGKVVVE